jgi:hypothetical protein
MTELDLPKAEASSKEVLATKANKAADATSGPDEAPSGSTYVTWTRPDGSSLVAPISNSETYEAKGFKKGAEFEMDSIVAWNQENAAKVAPKAKTAEAEPKAEKK